MNNTTLNGAVDFPTPEEGILTNDTTLNASVDFTTPEEGILTVVILCLALVALIVNCLNIYAVFASKLHEQLSFKLVITLSVCDSMVDLIVIVGFSYDLSHSDSEHHWDYLDMVFHCGSTSTLLTLIFISLDIFLKVKFPLRYKFMKTKPFKYILTFILVTALCLYPLPVIMILIRRRDGTQLEAIVNQNRIGTYVNVSLALVGFTMLLYLNIKVYREIAELNERTGGERFSLRKSSLTITVIVLTFFMLYLPVWVRNAMELLDDDLDWNLFSKLTRPQFHVIHLLPILLLVINTICAPVIYGFRIADIRSVYSKWLSKVKCCQ